MASLETHDELRIGTRNSQLALVQAERVSNALASVQRNTKFPWQTVSVRGDVDKDSPFLKFSGPSDAAKNIWTEEMEAKLTRGELDMLVHCLKDMPTRLPPSCLLGAIVHREDPTDALVVKVGSQYTELAQFPSGSVIGTSSTRRKALLKYSYPHLVVKECRGNLDTRLRKLDAVDSPFAAIILATAGLIRIKMDHRITKRLPPSEFPYAVGQGALGIEVRKDDARTLGIVRKIEDLHTRWICLAERSLLRTIQGGCSSPVAVNCSIEEQSDSQANSLRLNLSASVIHPYGTSKISASYVANVENDSQAEELGAEVARLLFGDGAEALLEEIRQLAEEAINGAQVMN